MQTLDVISVNFWQIIVSLLNLVVLYLIVRLFLYKPVNRVLKERQEKIDSDYKDAEAYRAQAEQDKNELSLQLKNARQTADEIISSATSNAELRGDKIILEAKEQAESIIKRAEAEALLERKKAEEGIKHEIVNVSALLAEKMLEREINTNDHHALIDSFIEKIGETDDRNE